MKHLDKKNFLSQNHSLDHLVILITEECNLRCGYCYINNKPGTMSKNTALKAVELLFAENKPPNDVSIAFFGGEPLLKPKMIEFIHDYAINKSEETRRKISFSMTTNGTLLSEENAEMIERLGIKVTISLDGIKESHDKHRRTITGEGSFHLIEKNIKRALRLPNISVRLTVSPETAAILPQNIEGYLKKGSEL